MHEKAGEHRVKVILSRKGFDSGYGGWASPVLPHGRMLSLPILAANGVVSYNDLSAGDGVSYLDIMRQLRHEHEDKLILLHGSRRYSCVTRQALNITSTLH